MRIIHTRQNHHDNARNYHKDNELGEIISVLLLGSILASRFDFWHITPFLV
jgi:hypothetical protein